mmetsp:Transcript_110951/g.264673  ORF Transcript_110951/g.264673 Transcript_110951/m.264673 type:complete len:210 (-) Transcript_110951:108-737(-)
MAQGVLEAAVLRSLLKLRCGALADVLHVCLSQLPLGLGLCRELRFAPRLCRALVDVAPGIRRLVVDQVLKQLVGPGEELVLIQVLPGIHCHSVAMTDRAVVDLGGLGCGADLLLRCRLDDFSHVQGHLRAEVVQIQVIAADTLVVLHHVASNLLQGVHLDVLPVLAALGEDQLELRVYNRLPARGAHSDGEQGSLGKADCVRKRHLHCC